MRIVRTPQGELRIDETGKSPGRGAYLCREADCWKKGARKGSLERSLKTGVTAEERERLYLYFQESAAARSSAAGR